MNRTQAATSTATETFRALRDQLLDQREDYAAAYRDFRWPVLAEFNWALDWFDIIAAGNDRPALRVVAPDGSDEVLSFAQLSARSNQVANWLRGHGVARGDQVIVMLGNQLELWETILAATKLGAVIIPATTLLGRRRSGRPGRARQRPPRRCHRRRRRQVRTVPGDFTRIAVGGAVDGWLDYAASGEAPSEFAPDGPTQADDPLLLYFTSGTTAQPKLVEHTHASYPIGHLSTMYWIGLQPGDVHLNVSSPGWAKHAWSNVFAPWNAEATVLIVQPAALQRRRPARPDGALRRHHVLRAADRLADDDPGGSRPLERARRASWSAPASRSTPR